MGFEGFALYCCAKFTQDIFGTENELVHELDFTPKN
jgi:hypothetical protein